MNKTFSTLAATAAAVSALKLQVTRDSELITEQMRITYDTDDIFNMYDQDGDGELKKREFKSAWKFIKLYRKANGQGIDGKPGRTLKAIDADGTKGVCQNEFRTWLCRDLQMCDEPSQDNDGDDDNDDNDDDDGDDGDDGYGDDTDDDDGEDGYGDDGDDDEYGDDSDEGDDGEDGYGDDGDDGAYGDDSDEADDGENGGPDQFNSIHLEVHNYYRAAHGAPALEYDAELAEAALEWSMKMAAQGGLDHSQCSGIDCPGENLAWNSNLNTAKTEWATMAWYGELYDPGYDFSNPGFTSGTGHFTQVVWKDSQKLGCGEYEGYITCRYFPAGNYLGRFEDNVFPRTESML